MKKLSLIIFVLIFCQITASSQSCLPDGITFTTQAQIDSFQINYPDCTEIEGVVRIQGNDITNLNGLNVLTVIMVGLSIQQNYNLTNLTGLDNLTFIGGSLNINANDALTNLSGLDKLTTIGGDLWIGVIWGPNSSLIDLTGLEGLTSIWGGISIGGNQALSSLTGLDNIDGTSMEGLSIFENSSLSTCDVQSVCDYLAGPGTWIDIHDNATGCNSQAEVEAACGVGIPNIDSESGVSIYPNPAKDILTISCKNGTSIEKVVIYNQTGQKVFEGKLLNNTIDVSGLRHGMYIIELVNKELKVRKKLIIR